MNYETRVEADAPSAVLWEAVVDVTSWPLWTASMDSVELLDGDLGLGKRARITQPRMRPMVWTVTGYEAGRAFTWEATLGGVTTVAYHEVAALEGGRSRLRQRLSQSGLLVPVTDLLLGRRLREYLELETAGHKACAERAVA